MAPNFVGSGTFTLTACEDAMNKPLSFSSVTTHTQRELSRIGGDPLVILQIQD
jgi:hypothetical protein